MSKDYQEVKDPETRRAIAENQIIDGDPDQTIATTPQFMQSGGKLYVSLKAGSRDWKRVLLDD